MRLIIALLALAIVQSPIALDTTKPKQEEVVHVKGS